MILSDFAINELCKFVMGEGELLPYRKGKELVNLFNEFGCRDVYDFDNGGLPKLRNNQSMNTSRTDYTKSRLKQLNGRIELNQLLAKIINDADNKDIFVNGIKKVLELEKGKYTIELANGHYEIIGGVHRNVEPVVNQAHFNDIQNQIICLLDKAQVSIIVAVAWFTNQSLADKLVEKQEQGVSVDIIIDDNGTNNKYCPQLDGCNITKVNVSGGIMHDKFCVIDNQMVITGSYNWTNNAEFKNEENIEVSEDPKLATEYSVKFRNLKQKNNSN